MEQQSSSRLGKIATCQILASLAGVPPARNLWTGTLSIDEWPKVRASFRACNGGHSCHGWLAVLQTGMNGKPAAIWLLSSLALDAGLMLVPVLPTKAASLARVWLSLRREDEVACSHLWASGLSAEIAALVDIERRGASLARLQREEEEARKRQKELIFAAQQIRELNIKKKQWKKGRA